MFTALNQSTESLVYINEDGFKYMKTDLKPTLTAINSLFEKKDVSIKVILSDKKDEVINIPFAFGIRLNNSKIKDLIELEETSARKIRTDEKSALLKAKNVVFDILNNDVYVIELSEGTKIFISKEKKLIYFNFSNLVLNIMKYNNQTFIININGIKEEIAFY